MFHVGDTAMHVTSSHMLQSADLFGPSIVLHTCHGKLGLEITSSVGLDRGDLLLGPLYLSGRGSPSLMWLKRWAPISLAPT